MKQNSTILFVLAAFTAVATAADSGWPQWRGPQRDGQFTGSAWPDRLDTNHLRREWRVELASSYSGPIVSGDRVFTTESKDKKFEFVTAFDRKTGKELWRAQWEGAMTVPFFAKSNGDWIRATPSSPAPTVAKPSASRSRRPTANSPSPKRGSTRLRAT